jgi:hypothetical protein
MKKIYIISLFLMMVLGTQAQDRIFNYVYQSTVLNKGQRELEIWNTFSWQKSEYFREFAHRIEFELGLCKNLQTSFYLNINSASEYSIGKKLVLKNSIVTEENDTSIATNTDFSFSNEWKYKLSDPVADFIGSAIYAEIALGTKETELEAKLILDKQFGKFTTTLNLVGAYGMGTELINGKAEDETEYAAEINYGLSYKLSSNFHLGLEANSLNSFVDGSIVNSVLYAGPVLSYVKDNFWLNLTVFPQITAFKGASDGGLDLINHSKLDSRLLFSYAF